MPYSKVQFVGYAINTAPATPPPPPGWTPSPGLASAWDQTKHAWYPGSSIPDRDIRARIGIMSDAMEAAFTSPSVDPSADCLKVFVAPEFFFRGIDGAYSMDDAAKVVEQLRALAKDSRWSNWLFVFGSIIAVSQSGTGANEVYNYVLVQKGKSGESGSRVVMKEWKSGIDFLSDSPSPWTEYPAGSGVFFRTVTNVVRGLTDANVAHLPPGGAPGKGKEKQAVNYGGTCVFQMDGITFAVEICLDHLMKRLRNSPPAVGEQAIQLQIVPSAGMDVKDESVVAVKNGFVFNCDGGYDLVTFGPGAHTQLKQVTKMFLGTKNAQVVDVAPQTSRAMAVSQRASRYYVYGPGQVDIFPSKPMPSAMKEQIAR